MVKSSWIHLCFDFVLGRNPAQSFCEHFLRRVWNPALQYSAEQSDHLVSSGWNAVPRICVGTSGMTAWATVARVLLTGLENTNNRVLFETCGTIFAICPHHGDSVMERLVRLPKFQRIPFRRHANKRSAGLKEFSFGKRGSGFSSERSCNFRFFYYRYRVWKFPEFEGKCASPFDCPKKFCRSTRKGKSYGVVVLVRR